MSATQEFDRVVWSTCNVNCGSRCPVRLFVRNGRVVRIEPDNTGDEPGGPHEIRACLRGRGLRRWVRDLNTLLRGEPALYRQDSDAAGFHWIDCHDSQQSVVSFLRRGREPHEVIACVCNFTPVPRRGYRMGVPRGGYLLSRATCSACCAV